MQPSSPGYVAGQPNQGIPMAAPNPGLPNQGIPMSAQGAHPPASPLSEAASQYSNPKGNHTQAVPVATYHMYSNNPPTAPTDPSALVSDQNKEPPVVSAAYIWCGILAALLIGLFSFLIALCSTSMNQESEISRARRNRYFIGCGIGLLIWVVFWIAIIVTVQRRTSYYYY